MSSFWNPLKTDPKFISFLFEEFMNGQKQKH